MNRTVIVCFLAFLISSCLSTPGGGGSTQTAPHTIRAEEGGLLRLELSVWGAGGPIEGRYTDVVAFHRLVGQNTYTSTPSKLVSQDKAHQIYEFRILPYPRGTAGEIEYYFELKLDGHHSRVNGKKRIKLSPT